jgi:hypothetical protein
MKTYYAECIVNFTDNFNLQVKGNYSFIVEANNKKEGKADVKKRAIEAVENQFRNISDIQIVINTFINNRN